ncbi:gluzincin family metallopeptidase [Anaplasma capra]|uniref:carboxypeptidase n=1 Tax=Anaplasma capra TaxID=1562740 RepID=UPI0021D5BFEF|nr:carboxypeptidase [Anaplasma capra]MCU7611515.1 carboxypeptidase [Anaplasma capra]MCU7612046.1 carboxypeptidase [Anaplasma capra]
MRHYRFLEQVFAKVRHLSDATRVLYFDDSDFDDRVSRVCTLREVVQEIVDSEMVSEAINSALANKGQLGDWEVANLHCMHRMYKHFKGLPVDLMCSLTRATAACRAKWMLFYRGDEPARSVLECLSDVVKLSSDVAAIRAGNLGAASKYDVMLGAYDGDLTTKKMDEVFTDMGAFFRQFAGEVMDKQSNNEPYPLKVVAVDKQVALHRHIADAMGGGLPEVVCSRMQMGVLSEEGVVCSVQQGDVDDCGECDYRFALRDALENAGKFLYCSNLPQKWKHQPVGGCSGSVMYEAQGALMSYHIFRDRGFIAFMLPAMKKLFSLRGKAADVDNIYSYFTEVRPSMLLGKSDEVSSLAHIMLRYALEKEIINDNLKVSDLPDAWAQGMRYYFDSVPSDDREGFMQDDFWVSGIFGYMPCKVMASIAAAQIFSAIKNNKVDVCSGLEHGDFSGIIAWLNKHIYSHGGRYSSTTLLKKITGKRVDVDAYKNYLIGRYLSM